ncbi:MAG: GNAT family N-acetyltransferase [Actinomycetota bacterium]|nr:GNAT family N-acetyltransferase [Actinomycetota bacterium]
MGETNVIETSRLVLKPLSGRDLDEMHALWAESGVRRRLVDGKSITREKARDFLRRSDRDFEDHGHGLWGVRRKESENLIGFCGLFSGEEAGEAELLYGLSRSFRGEGFAVEAAEAAILFGFAHAGLVRIRANADEPNVASIKVMERLGMHFEGREVRDGGSLVHYEARAEEFPGV